MVRTKEGLLYHQQLVKAVAELFQNDGYRILTYATIGFEGKKVDVLAQKGKRTVAVECQVRPSITSMSKRVKELENVVDEIWFAIPDWATLGKPIDAKIMRISLVGKPESSGVTALRISTEMKAKLDGLKIHPREPYEDVLKRLIERGESAKAQARVSSSGLSPKDISAVEAA